MNETRKKEKPEIIFFLFHEAIGTGGRKKNKMNDQVVFSNR